MSTNKDVLWLGRWQRLTLIVLQLIFVACASSVLTYRALGWASEVISFGWASYRAFNIYISIALVAYFVIGLLRTRQHPYFVAALTLFVVFHLVEGLFTGFWAKAILQLMAIGVLSWRVLRHRSVPGGPETAK